MGNEKERPKELWRYMLLGGGHGARMAIEALKTVIPAQYLRSGVGTFDNGGSTRQVRKDFSIPALGDLGQHMKGFINPYEANPFFVDLFEDRFDKGKGSFLDGHSMSNIILARRIQRHKGDLIRAVEELGRALGIKQSRIYPVTLDNCQLHGLPKEGGAEIVGEDVLDTRPRLVSSLKLEPAAQVYIEFANALVASDVIIFTPGSWWTSIRPILCVKGVREAIRKAMKDGARVVLMVNLFNKKGETDGYTVGQFADELCDVIGIEKLHATIFNIKQIEPDILDLYAADGDFPVLTGNSPRMGHFLGANLVRYEGKMVRHNIHELAKQVLNL
jgi:uncharacterized cofD-like protein